MRASILDLRRENGNPNIKTSATAGGGVEVQSAADSGDSFFHAGQSQAGALAWFLDKGMVEADTVVLNFAREKVRVLIDVDRNGRGSRVLHNIIERLLKNPVESDFDRGRKAPFGSCRDTDRQSCSNGDGVGKKMKRWNQTQIVQDGRAEFVRVLTELRFHLFEQLIDIFEIIFELRRGLAFQIGERQMNRREKLTGSIMNGVRDALDFLFEQFVHPAQRRNGFLKTAVSHFVRRKHFRKKFTGQGSDLIEAVAAIPLSNHEKERLLVHEDKFNEARAASHRLSANFVSLAEGGFILTEQVSF